MLSANQLNALKALVLEQKPLVTVTALTSTKTGSFEPGQKFQGAVQAQVAQGVFKVRIADQVIQMQLPSSIKSGDTIVLQVVSTTPRLVFSMSASTNPLSTPEELSSTSRLLSALSQQQPEKGFVNATQKTPLWPTVQAPDSKQVAGALREALTQSGLFYESHQAQWIQGGRSTEQLLQEPQNQMPQNQMRKNEIPQSQVPNQATVSAEGRERMAIHSDDAQRTLPAPQEVKTPEIPEHLRPLVQQQLNALETRQMVWQGFIWPGQIMQWEVHEREQSAHNLGSVDDQRQWDTTVSLNLPKLGGVSAKLQFSSKGLGLILNADNPVAHKLLSNAAAQLVAALTENGISITNMQVAQHADAQ